MDNTRDTIRRVKPRTDRRTESPRPQCVGKTTSLQLHYFTHMIAQHRISKNIKNKNDDSFQ